MKKYLNDALDYVQVFVASGGTMTLLLSAVDMVLKILVSVATLIFIGIKIKHALKKDKNESNK